jgi:hypothetical protein
MGSFTLHGKIISKDKEPLGNLNIYAYDHDPILKPDDFLGSSSTDPDGFFSISFDETKFRGFWEPLDRTPDVYIMVKDSRGNDLLNNAKKKVKSTKREIEYHVRIADNTPDPSAADIYSENIRRIVSMLREVGIVIGRENTINLDLLRNGDLSRDVRERLQNFVDGFDDRNNNFEHFLVIISSVVNSVFEEWCIGRIGYDGPQVPRQPRREQYDQTIIWPREEGFKWA